MKWYPRNRKSVIAPKKKPMNWAKVQAITEKEGYAKKLRKSLDKKFKSQGYWIDKRGWYFGWI